jgi:hypothetical protein
MSNNITYPKDQQENENQRDFSSIPPNSPEPIPLFRKMGSPKPYPFELLGEVLGRAAKRIHEIVQAPDAICGQSILGAAALVVQPFANVKIDGRVYPLSLFLATIGDSGERKSGADDIALKPIHDWQKLLVESHKVEMKKYQDKKDIWAKARQKILTFGKNTSAIELERDLESLEEPLPPLEPLFLCNEPTIQGLEKHLKIGQPTFGVFSDEGGRVLTGYSMKENAANMAGALSQLWDGKPLDRLRAKDGGSVMYGKRVSIHLLMQPLFFEVLAKDRLLLEQGLIPRFLFVYPNPKAGTRVYQEYDLSQDPDIKAYYETINRFLDTELPVKDPKLNELNPREVELDVEAKALWIVFNNKTDEELGEGKRFHPIKAMGSKAANQVIRIAGIFSLIEDFDSKVITIEHMQRAILLVDYYLDEALRIDGFSAFDSDLVLAAKVLNWLKRRGSKPFAEKDIYKNGPQKVRKVADARRAMKILLSHRQIIPFSKEGGDFWIVNPSCEIEE